MAFFATHEGSLSITLGFESPQLSPTIFPASARLRLRERLKQLRFLG